MTETLDVALHAEGAQVVAHGTLLDVHLFAQFVGHGGGELMGEQLHDASALVTLRDALLECFDDIDIEVDEDVADVPWPFE